ncbi:MAG: adenosylcobinamide-GDP ribazoletransferase [Bacillota bacterium]
MFKSLRIALGFLTRLPVNPRDFEANDLGDSLRFFPVVGVVYGILTWSLLQLLSNFLAVEIAAWLTVFSGAFLNGCIHWDGWADTADGLGGAEAEKRLAIMKDSRLGAFGGIALAFLAIGKVFTLEGLAGCSLANFVAVSTLSRWGMALLIFTQPSVSKGLLQAFQPQNRSRNLGIATLIMLALLSFAWPVGFLLLAITLVTLLLMAVFVRKRFGGITGDILGAGNELVELVCWLSLNIIIKF